MMRPQTSIDLSHPNQKAGISCFTVQPSYYCLSLCTHTQPLPFNLLLLSLSHHRETVLESCTGFGLFSTAVSFAFDRPLLPLVKVSQLSKAAMGLRRSPRTMRNDHVLLLHDWIHRSSSRCGGGTEPVAGALLLLHRFHAVDVEMSVVSHSGLGAEFE